MRRTVETDGHLEFTVSLGRTKTRKRREDHIRENLMTKYIILLSLMHYELKVLTN